MKKNAQRIAAFFACVSVMCLTLSVWLVTHWTIAGKLAMTGAIFLIVAVVALCSTIEDF